MHIQCDTVVMYQPHTRRLLSPFEFFSIVYKWENKFVRLDFSVETDIRILHRSFPPGILVAP